MGKGLVIAMASCLTLAFPAGASAHASSATVALDYRLVLDPASKAIPGVSASILDGDRDLRLRVRGVTVVVRGDLGEAMLRIGRAGIWVNRASVTAVAERLTTQGRGWSRVASGGTFTWHEHRLAPPPYDAANAGPVARFAVPLVVDGRPATIGGSFVRYRRPSVVPWAVGAVALLAAAVAAARLRPSLRPRAAVVLGAAAGFAALAGLATFDAADAPNGRVAWAQIGLAAALGAAVYLTLWRLRGIRRAHFGAVVGVAAGAVSLGSLGVFRHGVVISLVPAAASRVLCLVALAGGAAAAWMGYLAEERR